MSNTNIVKFCPECRSTQIVGRGIISLDEYKYECLDCETQFTANPRGK